MSVSWIAFLQHHRSLLRQLSPEPQIFLALLGNVEEPLQVKFLARLDLADFLPFSYISTQDN
jgi:hypothetical protein